MTTLGRDDDYEWALERVQLLCASAYIDAVIYGKKLLKGFGYPNETFRAAQDAHALSIVLARCAALETALRALTHKWRYDDAEDVIRRGYAEAGFAMQSCANELEALLSAEPSVQEPQP